MLNKLFAKPIEIAVDKQLLKFSSLADFEFALASRTSVPPQKITNMMKLSIDELKKEAKTIKEIEKQFVLVLSKSIEEPESIDRGLREMDAQIFSQDHSWRSIIAALHDGDEKLNEFRRVALVKYMQYLSSRQEIIKHLYSKKKKHIKSNVLSNTETNSKLKETLILENTVFEPLSAGKIAAQTKKMPKGENVTIKLTTGETIDVLISKHPCKIISKGSRCKFIDQAGRSYNLKIGKTIIGRDNKNDIVIDPNLRDVSRLHLIIETDDFNTLYMTDFSAHGTYIPSTYLASDSF